MMENRREPRELRAVANKRRSGHKRSRTPRAQRVKVAEELVYRGREAGGLVRISRGLAAVAMPSAIVFSETR